MIFLRILFCTSLVLIIHSSGVRNVSADTKMDSFKKQLKNCLHENSGIPTKNTHDILHENARIYSVILSGILIPYLFNMESVESQLRIFMNIKEIQAILVTDDSNESVGAVWRRGEVSFDEAFPKDLSIENQFSVTKKIVMNDQFLGTVKVFYSNRYPREKLLALQKSFDAQIDSCLKR